MINYVVPDEEPWYTEEEIGGKGYSKPTYKFFPLKQYRLRDPCKVCLVQACCRSWCDEKYKNIYFRRWMYYYKRAITQKLKYHKLELIVESILFGGALFGVVALSIFVFILFALLVEGLSHV